MLIIIVSSLIIIGALAGYAVWRNTSGKARLLEAFERLAATMQIEGAEIKRLPLMTLSGRYKTYPLIIECAFKKNGRKKVEQWSFSAELKKTLNERFYLQSETQEGRLRKVVDLDVISTNDELFDNRIMVFSSNSALAKRIFNSYLRHRMLWAGFSDFVMEVGGSNATLEIYVESLTNVRYIRHSLEVWTEFLNILESV
ncbi:MAG: hypothetical protein HYY43_02450 [Deltaproteobacteria bacterium]|nr:hypothetical protein [Deltaproteobacteria bacterium]MBI2974434.1 hypothetical protein [Deltaproteobacteria bacterium]